MVANDPRRRRYDDNAAERSLAEPSRRSHHSHPQLDRPIIGCPGTHGAAAPDTAPRQQAGSDSVRRLTESNPRVPQQPPHYGDSVGGHSVARGTTGSSSSSRGARNASVQPTDELEHPQPENVLMPHMGSWIDAAPPFTISLSMTGSPPRQPSNRDDRGEQQGVSREEKQQLRREEKRRADRQKRKRSERRAEQPRRPDYDYE